jgi:hypothetical protein
MAKSLLSTKALKKKAPRKTKSENYLVNWKYLGEEPKGVTSGTVDLLKALNWYNTMAEKDDARQYLKDYFKSDKIISKLIDRIPDSRLPSTSAWLCRIASNNVQNLTPEHYTRVIKSIQDAAGFEEDVKEDKAKPVVVKPSIQDRVRDRIQDIIGDVEELLDKGEKVNMYEWLQKNEIPAMHANKIADFYQPLMDEYLNVLNGDKEGYERFTKKQMLEKQQTISDLLDSCRRFAGNVKKARAPRKKKAPTMEKLFKNFTYLKAYNEYKLQSIDPATIIGAQELWTFDIKYNKLTVFRARGPAGLTVKRTAIDGYDVDNTVSKRIGRKTEETLKKVLSGGKIVLRKLMDEITSDPITLSDRINSNVVLIKVSR